MGNSDGFSGGDVLLAFILGGIVGAGAALLMAPDSGENVRKKIREFADDARSKAGEYAGQTRRTLSSTMEKGRDLYEEKKSAITSAIEAGKEAYQKERGDTSEA